MKAMILAAGLGTRLQEMTTNKPKALVEINGVPMLQMIIERLKKHGFNYIVINVHHHAKQIKEFLNNNDFGIDIDISDESDLLLNTGGGIKNAEKFLKGTAPFLVHNVDIYSEINLADMYNYHLNSDNLVTMAVRERVSTNFLLFDDNNRLCGWRSYKTNSEIISIKKNKYNELAFSGIHVISPKIFDLFTQTGSFSIINEYLDLAKNHIIGAYIHNNKDVLDLGRPEAIKKIENKN